MSYAVDFWSTSGVNPGLKMQENNCNSYGLGFFTIQHGFRSRYAMVYCITEEVGSDLSAFKMNFANRLVSGQF